MFNLVNPPLLFINPVSGFFVLKKFARVLAALALVSIGACDDSDRVAKRPLAEAEQALADIITARQNGFKDLGSAFKAIRDELNASQPDLTMMEYSARAVNNYAQDQLQWFPSGSSADLGVQTRAKNLIWSANDEFQDLQEQLRQQTRALYTASQAGELSLLQKQYEQTAQVCRTCHDKFREDDD